MPIAARFWRWYAMLLSRLAVLLHADCCCCCCCCCWCCWCCCCCCCCCCWWASPELAGLCEQCVGPAPAVCGDWPLPIPDRAPPPTEPSPVPEHGFPSFTSTGTATLRGELCAWNITLVMACYSWLRSASNRTVPRSWTRFSLFEEKRNCPSLRTTLCLKHNINQGWLFRCIWMLYELLGLCRVEGHLVH
jgi:hypothetical protein